MKRLARIGFAALIAACGVAAAAPASANDFEAASCEDNGVLSRIMSKFRHQVLNVPGLPDVQIVAFGRIHQHRYEPYAEKSPIARRYCGASVDLSNGARRELFYLIEDSMGFVGIGDGVEFCVSGFDRWYVHNGRCRVVR